MQSIEANMILKLYHQNLNCFSESLQYLYIMLSNGPEKKVLPNPKVNSPTYNSTVVPSIKRNIAKAVKAAQ